MRPFLPAARVPAEQLAAFWKAAHSGAKCRPDATPGALVRVTRPALPRGHPSNWFDTEGAKHCRGFWRETG